jgi:phenylalanyl-tRNA synthetase beta chain
LATPLSEEEPDLRTTLLPGLLATLRWIVGRGFDDVALFETGVVYRPNARRGNGEVPRPSVSGRPTADELRQLEALLPDQPLRIAVVLSGAREPSGWWGGARESSWSDAIEAAQLVARCAQVELDVSADEHAPWHPGRCAALKIGGTLVGHAGELHPRVISSLVLPPRTCAMELGLDRLVGALTEEGGPAAITKAPRISPYPVAKEDVALVVADSIPAAEVARALLAGGGELLESARLFDVYSGEQVGAGKRSLAFSLRLRAPDRTLTPEEIATTREAAVAEAARRVAAVLRS